MSAQRAKKAFFVLFFEKGSFGAKPCGRPAPWHLSPHLHGQRAQPRVCEKRGRLCLKAEAEGLGPSVVSWDRWGRTPSSSHPCCADRR